MAFLPRIVGIVSFMFIHPLATALKGSAPGLCLCCVLGKVQRQAGAGLDLKVGLFLQYLLGSLESTNAIGGCTYTRFGGMVMQHGFGDGFALGCFVAERLPP